mmetsp:Transcript_51980/g.126825  ORF Transcript_51980/g.126825 Transcript_51980/m.126825 type:complete len:365 (-) Transcript_51980:812-1906(-)
MLRRRAPRPRLEEAPAREQRHDREHLGAGAELDDGEEVREVVPQHVARNRDCVLPGGGTLHRQAHGLDGGVGLDVEAFGVVLLEVHVDLGLQVRVVRPVGVEPEDGRVARGARARHGQLDPVPDWSILGLAHTPDVALLHGVREHLLAAVVGHADGARSGDLERLVVGAVLLRLLGHQPDVADVAHRRHVELPLLLDVVEDLVVEGGVAAVGDHCLAVLELVVLVPHLARVPDHDGHGGVDDDIRGHVQVGDALGGVDHGDARAGLILLHNVRLDRLLLRIGQLLNLLVHVPKAVVGVHAELVEGGAVLLEHVAVEGAHAVPKHDGIRDLHHRGLEVKREEDVLLLGVGDFLLKERDELLLAHH